VEAQRERVQLSLERGEVSRLVVDQQHAGG